MLDVNVSLVEFVAKQLGVSTKTAYASVLDPKGAKTELLIDICSKVGASCYLSGPTAKDYLRPELFEENSIALMFMIIRIPSTSNDFPVLCLRCLR